MTRYAQARDEVTKTVTTLNIRSPAYTAEVHFDDLLDDNMFKYTITMYSTTHSCCEVRRVTANLLIDDVLDIVDDCHHEMYMMENTIKFNQKYYNVPLLKK